MQSNAILLIYCPDKKGITASLTNFIYEHKGNIVHADQHIDEQTNIFFIRLEWSLKGFTIKTGDILKEMQPLIKQFGMTCQLHFSDSLPNIAIFVSKHLHCLYDLLYRHQENQLRCRIAVIISNHIDAQKLAKQFGISFVHIPITTENKKEQEKKEMKILADQNVECVVLARYHQLLTAAFIKKFNNRIINIHHSFLPAFVGQNPYRQAFNKGVKIIGATSHYVTEDLDQGPIIEQDTVRISHRDFLADLVRKGEDLEKIVLSRAVRLYLERKILSYNNKTVIFD